VALYLSASEVLEAVLGDIVHTVDELATILGQVRGGGRDSAPVEQLKGFARLEFFSLRHESDDIIVGRECLLGGVKQCTARPKRTAESDVVDGTRAQASRCRAVIAGNESHEGSRQHANYHDRFGYR
jgi:hypothetical protein